MERWIAGGKIGHLCGSLGIVLALLSVSCESVKVVNVGVATVSVSPGTMTLVVDETAQLAARVVDDQGNVLTGRTPQWTTDNSGVVSVSSAGLVRAVGPGRTSVRATVEGRSGTATVTVLAGPSLQLGRTSVAFGATRGSGDPPPQTVAVTNEGAGELTGLTSAVSYAAGPGDWLTVVLSTTTAPAELRVRASVGDLAPGVYRATITVDSPVAENGPQTLAATLEISEEPPAIVLDPASLGFNAIKGENDPSPRSVDVTNGGAGTLSGLASTVVYEGSPTGWLEAELASPTAPTELVLQPRTGSLDEGVYSARVRVTAPAAPNSPQEVSVTFTIGQPPPTDVSVRKEGPDTIGGGEEFDYVITVSNRGPALAVGVVVRDSLPAEVTFESASDGGAETEGVVTWPILQQLAVGDSVVRRVTVTAPDTGLIVNVAFSEATTDDPAPGNNDGSAEASRVVTVVNPLADIELVKTGPDSVDAGQTFTYTIQIFNRGPSTARTVAVADLLPVEVTFLSASLGAVPDAAGDIVWPALDELEAGQNAVYQVTVRAPANAPPDSMENAARSVAETDDPDTANNDGTDPANRVLTRVFDIADVTVAKAGPARANAGSPVTYTVTVANDGPSDAGSVTVRDTIPSGATFISASNGGTASGGVITWPAVALAAGDTIVRSATVAAPLTGPAINIAVATSPTFDPVPANNDGTNPAARVSTDINRAPVVAIVSPTNGAVFTVGASVTFTGSGTDPEEGALGGGSLVWTSDQDGGIGTGPSFSTTGLSAGTHVITLTGTDSEGASGDASVTVRINVPPTPNITSPAANAVFTQGTSVTFTGTASDPEDGALGGASLSWSSDRDGTLGTGTSTSSSTLSVGAHTITLTATDSDGASATDQIAIRINARPTASVTTPAPGAVFQPGETVTLNGTGNDPEDGSLSGAALAWSSNRDGALGTGSPLNTSSLSVGTHVLTLTVTDSDGASGTDQVSIRVNAQPVPTILTPSNGTVVLSGSPVAFTGTASDAEDGALAGPALEWTSSIDGALGTGSPLVTASLSPGTHTITLTATDSDGGSGSTQITLIVNRPPTATVTGPAGGSVFTQGAVVPLTGTGSDPEDGTLSGSSLAWSSSLDGALGSGTALNVSTLSVGTHVITLTATDANGASDSDQVTLRINARPVPTITAPGNGSVFLPGENVSLVGTATDQEDGVLVGTSLVWTSSIDGALGSGSPRNVSTLSIGTHTITLTATDADGATGTTQISIRINAPPTATITGPADNSVHTLGASVTFTGTGTDPEDGSLPGPSLSWSSNVNGALGTGGSLSTSSLLAGVHTITLTATDSDGSSDSDQITIRINQPPTANITSPANFSVFDQGAAVPLAGSGSDPEDGGLSGASLVWTSSLDGGLGSGGSLTPTNLSVGVHAITLTATDVDGAQGTAQITVTINGLPTATITAPGNGSVHAPGASVAFAGSASDPEDGALTGAALQWSSSVDGAIGSGTSFSTTTLSIGSHTITLTATDSNGATGTAAITLRINAPPSASVTSPAAGSVHDEGAIIGFQCDCSDPEDGALSGSSVAWSSDLDGATGTGNPLNTGSLSVGTHTVTVTATDSDGASANAQVTVRVNAAPTANITSPAGGSVFQQGASVSFSGTGTDTEDGALTGGALQWESDRDGAIGSGVSFSTTGLTAGTHLVTLTATDTDGASGSAQITIRINAPPVPSITTPATGSSFPVGSAINFQGAGTDAEDGALSGGALQWTSDLEGNIGSGTSFATSSLSLGDHTITLTATDSDGGTAFAQIAVEVQQPPTATITGPADGSTHQEGALVSFTGSGNDPEDGPLSGASLTWSSDLDGNLGSGTPLNTASLSAGNHTVTLTATDSDNAQGTDQISITVNAQPTAQILAPANGSAFVSGTEITFTGQGNDAEDGALSGAALQWTSNLDGSIGSGTSFSTTTLSTGIHTITLTVTDTDGGSAVAQITVTIL